MKYTVTLEDGSVILPPQDAKSYGAWFDQRAHHYVFLREKKSKRLVKFVVKDRDF